MASSDVVPSPTHRFHSKDTGEEFLFYDSAGDRLHVLNGTAREIYSLCDGTKSVLEIARVVSAHYDVDPETVLRDAAATVDQLVGLGVLEIR